MKPWLITLWNSGLKTVREHVRTKKDSADEEGEGDRNLWGPDENYPHVLGEYSIALVRGNAGIEDFSQVETRDDAIFVGVYDGHAGPDAAHYASRHVFSHFVRYVRDNGEISDEILRQAISATEMGFMAHATQSVADTPTMAITGTCCLVGAIRKGTLYIANLGDSRAVVGFLRENKIRAEQLTNDHNAKHHTIRKELKASHRDDPQIVAWRRKAWRVKGVIQISRSIGDLYMKYAAFAVSGEGFKYFQPLTPVTEPALSAEPELHKRVIKQEDQFFIFASDGLWDVLTIKEAAEIVHKGPRAGIARRLVVSAVKKAAWRAKWNGTYAELKKVGRGAERRVYHDDITVVVVFIDAHGVEKDRNVPVQSVRGYDDGVGASGFARLEAPGRSDEESEGRLKGVVKSAPSKPTKGRKHREPWEPGTSSSSENLSSSSRVGSPKKKMESEICEEDVEDSRSSKVVGKGSNTSVGNPKPTDLFDMDDDAIFDLMSKTDLAEAVMPEPPEP